jgi:hypothetical protein
MNSFENIKLSLDDEFFNEIDLEGVMISPVSAQIGALVASKQEEDFTTVRIYRLLQDEETLEYYILDELIALNFSITSQYQ